MADGELFRDLPSQRGSRPIESGKARLLEPVRDQVELRAVDLEGLLAADHPARGIWAYVQKLDLGARGETIAPREHNPGQPPASPRLLLALWLYAISEKIGSARALARL